MTEILPGEDFEPSRDTKMLWRFTRKSRSTYAGATLPGLFHTANELWDTLAFFLVVLLEVGGLASLVMVGAVNVVYAVGIFALDLVLAFFRHLPIGRIVENENRLVYEGDSNRIAALRAQIHRDHFGPAICAFGIWLLAGFKVLSFYSLQDVGVNGLTLAVLVSYGVTAFIHAHATGYFIFLILFKLRWRRDRGRYEREAGAETSRTGRANRVHLFEADGSLRPHEVEGHQLVLDGANAARPAPAGKAVFELRSKGLLTDRQVGAFLHFQPGVVEKSALARELVRHQVDILQSQ